MRIELVRLEDEQAIARADFKVIVEDRIRPHEIAEEFDQLGFERPGRYEFRLFANERYLGGAVLGCGRFADGRRGVTFRMTDNRIRITTSSRAVPVRVVIAGPFMLPQPVPATPKK